MAKNPPKNPLWARLTRHRLKQRDVYQAINRLPEREHPIDRARLSILCRELPDRPGAPKPEVPKPPARAVLNAALEALKIPAIPDEDWSTFAEALAAQRAPFDRRRKAVTTAKPKARRRTAAAS